MGINHVPPKTCTYACVYCQLGRTSRLQTTRQQFYPVELLIGYEGNAFAATGDAAADLLSITAVHPLRDDAVTALLARCDATWNVVEDLVARGTLVATKYNQHTFYLRGYQDDEP